MIKLDLEKVNCLPVVVLSSPRTGSTIVANDVKKQLNYKLFNEPSQNEKSLHQFYMFEAHNKNYVLKEHTLWYLKKYSSEFLKQPSYKIRIRRKNIFEQVLSNFVAANRKKFLYNKDETFIQDKIELNESYLLESLEFIKNYNRETDLFRGNIDLDLYYEDLYITDTYTIPTPKPINNEELVNWAHNILKDKI